MVLFTKGKYSFISVVVYSVQSRRPWIIAIHYMRTLFRIPLYKALPSTHPFGGVHPAQSVSLTQPLKGCTLHRALAPATLSRITSSAER